jgi:hypothetical protein
MSKKISAKCITYGRLEWLQESLHSFLLQEGNYDSEMIIVNDYPLQKFEFNHPKVKIYNLDSTFNTIGEKENFAMSKCSGDIIIQWDDDDIAMKHHLNNVNKYFIEDTTLLRWGKGVFYNHPNITAITSLGNSGYVFSREAFNKIRGYPIENAGYDKTFINNLSQLDKFITANPPDNEVSWFYRWAGGDYHLSGLGDDKEGQPNIIARNAEHVEKRRKNGLVPTGNIQLKPNWRYNYQKMLNNYVNK